MFQLLLRCALGARISDTGSIISVLQRVERILGQFPRCYVRQPVTIYETFPDALVKLKGMLQDLYVCNEAAAPSFIEVANKSQENIDGDEVDYSEHQGMRATFVDEEDTHLLPHEVMTQSVNSLLGLVNEMLNDQVGPVLADYNSNKSADLLGEIQQNMSLSDAEISVLRKKVGEYLVDVLHFSNYVTFPLLLILRQSNLWNNLLRVTVNSLGVTKTFGVGVLLFEHHPQQKEHKACETYLLEEMIQEWN